ncbi:methyltransferase domain-containing protein [Haloimpatiens massiliensis]|uniref:methyltransferase domain-containing protein n=1 Tax=Haloimpatiens massiliensis TaxID=1658110 RepID=UPI000C8344D2|nr:methyltransferase domain-containing protein [Haloimpatiens massiliensis]
MNWYERINEAFDYIEEHLDSIIDLDKVANIMCQSIVSFQRTFSIFMNMSIYEYIRRRRMTLAAIELQTNSIKVIDVALKYGYESPESFTRAFKEIHGISPSAARKKGVQLNLFPRITFLLTVKGDIEMDYEMYNKNEQIVNLKGHNWAIDPSPQLKPVDNCIYLANKWRELGYVDLLDLGTGLGRNAIYFSKQGFNVTAMDISDYAVQYLKTWATKENLPINAEIGDMLSLHYSNQSFDCIFAYHVLSHTDSIGMKKTIAEIERVLKPNGEVYLSFCSKESTEFIENRSNKLDKNTLISRDELEKGIPHFYADLNDIKELLVNFKIELIKHTEYFYSGFNPHNHRREKFYYVNAILK